MEHCCEEKGSELSRLQASHSRVLYAVLWINPAMFIIEGTAGVVAQSTALLADALDMLGDALVYGFSLFVLTRSVSMASRRGACQRGLQLLLERLEELSRAA
jgi:Co/Zn/Cd efflux system component